MASGKPVKNTKINFTLLYQSSTQHPMGNSEKYKIKRTKE